MKRFLYLGLLLFTVHCSLFTAASAQTITGDARVRWVSALPAKCVPTDKAKVLVYKYTATTGLYYCSDTNTWTAVGTSGGPSFPLFASLGSATDPTYSFSGDTNTGIYSAGADTLNFTTGGTLRGTLSSAGLFTTTGGLASTTGAFSGVVTGANGSAAAPSYSFTSDPDTGIFRSGANALGFSTGGTERATLSSAGLFTTTGGLTTAGSITNTQGTLTGSSTPAFTSTATWNNGATTFKHIFANITNTASAADSNLLELQVGGNHVFSVGVDGSFSTEAVNSTACFKADLSANTAAMGDCDSNGGATRIVADDNSATITSEAAAGWSHTGGFAVTGNATITGDLDLTTAGSAINFDKTITAAGTTGNRTINKVAGTVNFAAAATAITVTNAEVDANSIILTSIRTADATCTFVKSAVPGAGSFVITLNAGCTAETSVGFFVVK